MDWDFAGRRLGFNADGTAVAGRITDDRRFRATISVGDHHIDEMRHVNNAVWLFWLQDIAAAHWYAAARPEDRDRLVGIVLRHEVDYRANVGAGAEVNVETWIDGPPRGIRCTRRAQFTDKSGKLLVSVASEWGMIDRDTGGLVRVTSATMVPFLPGEAVP